MDTELEMLIRDEADADAREDIESFLRMIEEEEMGIEIIKIPAS
jgi:hypothetical protein